MILGVQDDETLNSGVMSYLSSFVFSDVSTDMTLGLEDYLSFDMNRKLIKNIILPGYDTSYNFESYKVCIRNYYLFKVFISILYISLNKKK